MQDPDKGTAPRAAPSRAAGPSAAPRGTAESMHETRQWAMALHLSLLAGYLVPLAGFIAPIVIWQVKKHEMPELDLHGRIVANWMVSLVLYFALSLLLVVVLVGIPLLWALGIIAVVFPIIGAIKASQGEVWRYPGSVAFFG